MAWVLARYDFPGRRLLDAAVDLPFALPTAVAGIALAALYAPNGWIGALFAPSGIKVAFTPLGILIALVFIGLPFVVRTVQPVLRGARPRGRGGLGDARRRPRWQTVRASCCRRSSPALLTGFALAFARGVGEYGSVIFIAGNMPLMSGDRAAADRHQARGVRLRRRRRDRVRHAGDLLRHRCSPSTSLQAWTARRTAWLTR